MRLVLLGASHFAERCLETALGNSSIEVVGVVTAPKEFAISYRPQGVTNVLHADLQAIAAQHAVPVAVLEAKMSDPTLLETVAKWNPTAFLVAGWYHMVPKPWRQIAPAYGLHASLLPDYSGGAPLVWAMINGESTTGITLFEMDDGVDSGPIVDQRVVSILPADTIASLYGRIEEAGIDLVQTYLTRLGSSDLPRLPQDETRRRIMPQRSPEDGRIDWSRSARYIDRFVRAQTRPYPGAFTELAGRRLTIWRTALQSEIRPSPSDNDPGTVTIADHAAMVHCAAGRVVLLEVEFEGQLLEDAEILALLSDSASTRGISTVLGDTTAK